MNDLVDGAVAAVRATWTGVMADGTELRSHSALTYARAVAAVDLVVLG